MCDPDRSKAVCTPTRGIDGSRRTSEVAESVGLSSNAAVERKNAAISRARRRVAIGPPGTDRSSSASTHLVHRRTTPRRLVAGCVISLRESLAIIPPPERSRRRKQPPYQGVSPSPLASSPLLRSSRILLVPLLRSSRILLVRRCCAHCDGGCSSRILFVDPPVLHEGAAAVARRRVRERLCERLSVREVERARS